MLTSARYSLLASLLTLSLSGAAASAQTFVVDDTSGPGVDFDSIVSALQAVPSGAILDVREGVYDGFTVQREVTIVGQPTGVFVTSPVVVSGGSIDGVVVLSRFELQGGFSVADSANTLVLDNLRFTGSSGPNVDAELSVLRSTDVRLARVLGPRVVISDSRVQASECEFIAVRVGDPNGFAAVLIEGTSLVHLDHCVATGSRGEDCPSSGGCLPSNAYGGGGGPGVDVQPHAVLRAVRCTLVGGFSGADGCECFLPPLGPGPSVRVWGRAELWANVDQNGQPSYNEVVAGGAISTTAPLPSLRANNAGQPGQAIEFDHASAPGSSRRILVGRAPVNSPIPGATIGRLVSLNRVASLGASPVEVGTLSFPQPTWSKGLVFYAQISQTLGSGVTEMSNSVAIVAP